MRSKLILGKLLKDAKGDQDLKTLALQIRDAHNRLWGKQASKPPVDRRKLSRLIKREEVTLSTSELTALDSFLGLHSTPIFCHEGILHTLGGSLYFFLASRERRERIARNDMNVWDVRAMRHLIDAVNKITPSAHFEFDDVILDYQETYSDRLITRLEEQLERAKGSSTVCSIGSPRSCLMSELMLAKMFNVEAFTLPERAKSSAPLAFSWPKGGAGKIPSRFIWGFKELCKHSQVPLNTNHSIILFHDGVRYEVRSTPWLPADSSTDYGAIILQRRGKQIWAVIAGLSGPGTAAAAQGLVELHDEAPEIPEFPKVLYCIVEAKVVISTSVGSDSRKLARKVQPAINFQCWQPLNLDRAEPTRRS